MLIKAPRQNAALDSKLSFPNSKQFYRYANSRLKQCQGIGPIEVDGRILVDDPEKATAFMAFFGSVYELHSVPVPLSGDTDDPAPTISFTVEDVEPALRSLPAKLSVTPEGIPPFFYKRLSSSLAVPLRMLFSRSYLDSDVPKLFRQSLVTPVPKEVIPCIVLERLVVELMRHHLEPSGQLDPELHGFTRGRSTESQLLRTVPDWCTFLNHKHDFHCIYFDFSKAFDKCCHSPLLSKLSSLGFPDRTVRWCAAYLRDRPFRVHLRNVVSDPPPCPSGVPQGSCLGPFLWVVYVLDLCCNLPTEVYHKIYADYLKLYAEITDDSFCRKLQRTVDLVADWADRNFMKLSPTCRCGP